MSEPISFIPGVDYYFNNEGKMVLTTAYLLKRGYCCGSGCIHCPYNEPAQDTGED